MRKLWLALLFALLPGTALAWTPTERTVHYTVSGTTGPSLYASIGERGPQPSIGVRAIAYTSWDLKWRRNYQPYQGGCRLESALPFLTITYTLPRPAATLSGPTARNWTIFYNGMVEHEHFHGVLVRQMTDKIISDTVGLITQNDPNCQQIRREVLVHVQRAYDALSQQSLEFDRIEMSNGGNVHQLILQLVNGG